MNTVPIPILTEIFSYLNSATLAHLSRVCKSWNEWINTNDSLWKWRCIKRWHVEESLLLKTSARKFWKDIWRICNQKFTWNTLNLQEGITVSPDLQSAGRNTSSGWFPTICSRELFKGGIVQFQVDSIGYGNVMAIGLSPCLSQKHTSEYYLHVVGSSEGSYGLVFDIGGHSSMILTSGITTPVSTFVTVGDIVGLLLDEDTRELHFLKNGSSVYRSLPLKPGIELYVCASFCNCNQLTLLSTQEDGLAKNPIIISRDSYVTTVE